MEPSTNNKRINEDNIDILDGKKRKVNKDSWENLSNSLLGAEDEGVDDSIEKIIINAKSFKYDKNKNKPIIFQDIEPKKFLIKCLCKDYLKYNDILKYSESSNAEKFDAKEKIRELFAATAKRFSVLYSEIIDEVETLILEQLPDVRSFVNIILALLIFHQDQAAGVLNNFKDFNNKGGILSVRGATDLIDLYKDEDDVLNETVKNYDKNKLDNSESIWYENCIKPFTKIGSQILNNIATLATVHIKRVYPTKMPINLEKATVDAVGVEFEYPLFLEVEQTNVLKNNKQFIAYRAKGDKNDIFNRLNLEWSKIPMSTFSTTISPVISATALFLKDKTTQKVSALTKLDVARFFVIIPSIIFYNSNNNVISKAYFSKMFVLDESILSTLTA